jgi:hypothetical protein
MAERSRQRGAGLPPSVSNRAMVADVRSVPSLNVPSKLGRYLILVLAVLIGSTVGAAQRSPRITPIAWFGHDRNLYVISAVASSA